MTSEMKEYKVDVGTKTRTIHVDYLARVEGEGAFYVRSKGNTVEEVRLKIFEPPRFFEGFLEGRDLTDAPDITSRICGICPIAYQMSAVTALEQGLGLEIPEYIQSLRRLIYCGEWIESHALHVYMLHAPDFLGYPDAIQMAAIYPEIVQRGLRLKKAGNEILKVVGGREVHPINIRVGGFYRMPSKKELLSLVEVLQQAQKDAEETITWVNSFTFPDLTKEYECISLTHAKEYPIVRGAITSSSGLMISTDQFTKYFEELHVPYSTALQAKEKGKGSYATGPIARYNICQAQLSEPVQRMIQKIGFEKTCQNPFRSIIVRAFELLEACTEALRLITCYEDEHRPPSLQVVRKACHCFGATEAPRGLLYHHYAIDEKGRIEKAHIIPPTAQNQSTIEEDLFEFVKKNLALSDSDLTYQCEQLIRNYDPCISCSTHFLKLEHVHA